MRSGKDRMSVPQAPEHSLLVYPIKIVTLLTVKVSARHANPRFFLHRKLIPTARTKSENRKRLAPLYTGTQRGVLTKQGGTGRGTQRAITHTGANTDTPPTTQRGGGQPNATTINKRKNRAYTCSTQTLCFSAGVCAVVFSNPARKTHSKSANKTEVQ